MYLPNVNVKDIANLLLNKIQNRGLYFLRLILYNCKDFYCCSALFYKELQNKRSAYFYHCQKVANVYHDVLGFFFGIDDLQVSICKFPSLIKKPSVCKHKTVLRYGVPFMSDMP